MSPTALEDRLAREARDGDGRALARIFSDYHQRLYRYCLTIVGNPEDAEDALQETMIKALRSLPGEEREIALRPWLYRVAHNESIELLRRRRASASLEESDAAPGEGLAEQVEVRERLRELIADLGALPERQRGVLLMREAAGLDFDEIGAALETTPAAARQTLYEARLGLREMDAGREMDCAAVTRALSDGDGRVRRRRDLRAHVRDCAGCRGFAAEIDARRTDLAAIAPLPAAAAAALLHGVLGGGAAAGGGGVAATAGAAASGAGALAAGGAAKSIGAATVLKVAAAAAVVAGLGVGAADRSGLINLGRQDPAPSARSSRSVAPAGGAPGSPTPATGSGAEHDEETAPGSKRRPRATHTKRRSALGSSRAAAPPRPRASVEETSPAPAPAQSAGGADEEPPAAASGNAGPEDPIGRAPEAKQIPEEIPAGEGPTEHPAHPIHPAHPSHPIHPVHPEKPAKPPKPAKAAKPTKPPKPPNPSKPAEPAEPKPAKSPKPAKETEAPAVTEAPPGPPAEHGGGPPGKGK